MFDRKILDQLNEKPITIAAVGHVNVGKSSVLQTLTHDPDVRRRIIVGPAPGVTIKRDDWKIKWLGTTYMVLRDTPGLQYATEALEYVGNHIHFRVDGVLRYFEAQGHSEDAEALKGACASDYLLYVVDVTEEPTDALLNEFAIFQKTRPMITLFNFVSVEDQSRREAWKVALEARGMFWFCEYDAHRFDVAHEEQLFNKLRAATEPGSLHFQALGSHIKIATGAWEEKTERASAAITDLLVACATTCTCREDNVEKKDAQDKIKELQEHFARNIAEAEYTCMTTIMEAHHLPKYLIEKKRAELAGEAASEDPFVVQGRGQWTTRGVSAAGGATIGLAIDAFTVVTFPAGTLFGALVGLVLGALGGRWAKTVYDSVHKTVTVRIEQTGLREILARAAHLLYRVQRRGLADDITEFLIGNSKDMVETMDGKACKEHVDALLDRVHPDRFRDGKVSQRDAQEIKVRVREVLRQVGIWKVIS